MSSYARRFHSHLLLFLVPMFTGLITWDYDDTFLVGIAFDSISMDLFPVYFWHAGDYSIFLYAFMFIFFGGILTADYVVPTNADLGRYRPIEVWVEHGDRLVVRLKGPHVDTEPRVRVQGLTDTDYRTNWSERGGPPYEIWAAPEPLPDILVLGRDNLEVELQRRTK